MSKKKEDSVSRTKAVATIPWLSAPTNIKFDNTKLIKLEQGDFCEEMLECEGKKNFKFYQMLNQIFPYFIAKRYHTMDSWSMHKKSSNGQYWNHASHFLMLNKLSNAIFYSYLQDELKTKEPNLGQFVPSYDIMGEVTRLEQCKSAAAFLLEPWVLIQLPLYPVVLHQWMVALMAETLRFQKELAEVLYLPHPSHMSSQLNQLKNMSETLFEATMQLTELVFEWCEPSSEALTEQLSEKMIRTKEKLNTFLPQVMPILEFVLSEKGKKIIKALKKQTWNKKNQLSHHDFKRGCLQTIPLDLTKLFSMYSLEFWTDHSPHIAMYYIKTAEDYAKFKSLDDTVKEFVEAGRGMPWIKPAREDFCKLIDEHIIKTGRLQGVSRDKILKAINWKDLRMKYYFHAMKVIFYTGATSQQNFAKDENYGVIFNIISLYADQKFEEAVVGLMSVLASQLINQGVYFGPVGCDDATGNVKMSDIKRALASVKPNNKWLHENLLQQVRATCFSPEREFFPDYNQGPKIIAEHFQERIKNLVFKMIETQSRMMKDSTVYVYPECQTVQYLLPCFVASFLDLEMDKSVSQEKKIKYLKFVHELVKSYEEKEFMQTLVKGWNKKAWFMHIQNKLMNWKVCHWVENIRDCLPREIATGSVLDAFCGNVLTFLTADICGSFEASYFKCKEGRCLKPWSLQMFMFLCRINSTLEDLSWLEDSRFHSVNFMACLFSLMQRRIRIKTPVSETILEPYKEFKVSQDFNELCKYLFDCKHKCLDGAVSCGCVLEMCLCLYLRAKYISQKNGKDRGDLFKVQSPHFPIDTTDSMMWNLEHQNWWKLMHQIKNFMSKCIPLRSKPLTVSLEYAREYGGYYLEDLTSAGKVKMSHPGEITFFPVEHCRWCGLVEVKEFRKCPECLENPDYMDVNIFCSEQCEKEALEKQHMEEHARFLMEKCGLFD